MSIQTLVGKRVLLSEECDHLDLDHISDIIEVFVAELSPSGKYVKLIYESDTAVWSRTDDVILVEVLNDNLKNLN